MAILKLTEQMLAYIAGFGLSEMFLRRYKLTEVQELLYYTICGIIAIFILYFTSPRMKDV
jgi:hypothetical protein